ncbi:MAG: ABC-F family ATP-binding cassette domain-containing protein [Myxococcales bacterium]|nr:ABC-F family ATP-binding cassette domain-containing protein [Myxococcales bacterium]
MPVLSARGIGKTRGSIALFEDVSLTIARGEKVGLLGVNGAGKSTLLRILAGLDVPDGGVIDRRRDASFEYLAQEPELEAGLTAHEIVTKGLAAWSAATERYAEVTRRIESGDAEAVHEQQTLAEEIERLGGWSRGHVVDDVLGRLGITNVDQRVDTMSGGERRRVALARLLVARPTLAILDEPTNHLDADTIAWLEEHLADEFPGAVLMVTHDRYVLDAVCERIVELDRGRLVEYKGGYVDFLSQKEERLAHEERTEQNRLNILRREKAWLLRGAKARTTKQKARIKRAEALMANEPVKAGPSVDLEGLGVSAPRTGRTILDLTRLRVEVAGRPLVKDLTLHLCAGDRIGIVGPNGAGKTSLLRVVTGDLTPAAGEVVQGVQTKIALFDQARAALTDEWTILENVAEREGAHRSGPGVVTIGDQTMEMRSYLEHFLFDSHKQRQTVGSLSGGERARVALAKILKSGANLLLLDEPTNDLDTQTLGALEELLESWPGAVIVVSHDRWFLDRVATSILAFEGDGAVIHYPGNYTMYRVLKEKAERERAASPERAPAAAPAAPAARTEAPKKGLSYAERLELETILDKISAAEERAGALESTLADPAFYTERAAEAGQVRADLEAAQAEVARLIARWEDLEARKDVKK